jgi:hypothetical protein
MPHAVVFDCEFLTAEGSPARFWCGPFDPDPTVAQIGLVRIGLEDDFPILDRLRLHVTPRDRAGNRPALGPVFTRLTGVTEAVIDAEGLPLREALARTERFADGARFWSWGKDEFNLLAISCYVEGFPPPLPATRFGNACNLLLMSGMPEQDIARMRSDRLSAHFGLDHPPLRSHDALDDALSVAFVLQHLLRRGSLAPRDLA